MRQLFFTFFFNICNGRTESNIRHVPEGNKLYQTHCQVPSVCAVNLKVANSTPENSLSTREKFSIHYYLI